MKRYLLLIAILLSGLSLLNAQDKLTLNQALTLALDTNYQVLMARNNSQMAENNDHMGNADLLPKIDLSGGATYQDQTPVSGTASATTQSSAQISASYLVFDGFGSLFRLKKLQIEADLGRAQSREQIEAILLDVTQAYYEAASASEQLAIVYELLTISRERLNRTRQRSGFGQANTVDVLSARVDFNNDSVAVAQAELRQDEARRNLNNLLNRDMEILFSVDTDIDFLNIPNLADLQQQALANNAGYRSAVHAEKQAKLNWRLTQTSRIPRVDLTGSYGYNQSADDFHVALNDPAKSWTVGASVSFNLFNGFQNHIQTANARLSYNNQILMKKQSRLDLEKDVANMYSTYRNSRLVLDLEKQNLEAAELNFQRTRDLYNLGQMTTTQFREAQLNLIQARRNISSAKYTAKLNEIELLRLSGQLMKAD